MAGRPKIYDEEKALDNAIEVFWEKGYENATPNELLSAMGIGKGSFYLAYKGGKQELFEKSVRRFFSLYPKPFLEVLKTIDNPTEAIRSYFYVMADPKTGFYKRGCYFANTVVQAEDKALKKIAGEQILTIAHAFTDAMKKAKKSGHIKTNLSPELLELYFINLWNGLNVTRNIVKDPAKLKALIDLNLKILE
ncbi:TetR/AcrR family transcriptional regulator [Niastella caeni]|uniref:TetR/AcrR family transcriptional regulator n=1 Tax=Niastella caeni TaxID=2569763 RepID=A0A4S8HXV9_9BACT|nr:TetR/AcrR family transcriptional regulator [Niastella caeni]THU40537.1 TetR/AcrR family transcriptional regulator [Niastella caeni]